MYAYAVLSGWNGDNLILKAIYNNKLEAMSYCNEFMIDFSQSEVFLKNGYSGENWNEVSYCNWVNWNIQIKIEKYDLYSGEIVKG